MKENHFTEFKNSFNDAVIETLVAFANTKVGKIYISLNDHGIPAENFSANLSYETQKTDNLKSSEKSSEKIITFIKENPSVTIQ